jgi:hypothetical protein
MAPIILSTNMGIVQWNNPNKKSGLVIMTHMHDDFECSSARNYVDTKSLLAYEENHYSTLSWFYD